MKGQTRFEDDDHEMEEKERDPFEKDPQDEEEKARIGKYLREGALPLDKLQGDSGFKNKKLEHRIKREARDRHMAASRAADAELLLPESAGYLELDDPLRKTKDVTQFELKKHVDVRTAQNSFSLTLDHFGPYNCSYTRNGKFLLLSGEKGHVALMDWKKKKLVTETHVKDVIHDACFLHNETWFALAQSKCVHIYDKNAVELHVLGGHRKSTLLDYLPYHWLLVSSGAPGQVHYHDVSTGKPVASLDAHSGPSRALRQNGANAIVCVGHAKGVLNMWTPTMKEPVVRMLCHQGPLTSIAFNRAGTTMVTAGIDSFVHIWDLRTYGKIQTIRTRRVAGQLDVSARGMLAVGDGTFLDVYNSSILSGGGSASGTPEPYMRVHTGSRHDVVHAARFCPWEDVLGVGSASGFRSAIIPGCGEPNLDTFEANPFASRQQRREGDVQALLDKAEPATIMLHPAQLGSLQPVPQDQEKDKKSMEKHKPRQKARESSGQRQRRKEAMSDAEFLQERKQKVLEERQRELEEKAEQRSQKKKKKAEASGDILARFLK